MKIYKGIAHKFGDDINTDYIISSRRKRDTLDLNILKRYIMEDIDSTFGERIEKGDIIVAGENFGCGSAMEVASLVVKAAGIDVIIAKSFSRTFYRNGINGGILLVELDTDDIKDGDKLEIRINQDEILIEDMTQDRKFKLMPLDGIMADIVSEGGLINYILKYGDFLI